MKLTENITNLSSRNKALYAFVAAQRLKSFYLNYWRRKKVGNPDLLNEIFEYAQEFLLKNEFNIEKGILLRTSFDLKIVDTNDDGSIYASYALDAGGAALNLLGLINFPKTTSVLDSFTHVIESVDLYIQEELDISNYTEERESLIMNHELMKAELEIQNKIVAFIKGGSKIDTSLLKEAVDLFGKSPFEIQG